MIIIFEAMEIIRGKFVLLLLLIICKKQKTNSKPLIHAKGHSKFHKIQQKLSLTKQVLQSTSLFHLAVNHFLAKSTDVSLLVYLMN